MTWNKGLTIEDDERLLYDRPTQFKKGIVPWNNGRKCPQISQSLMGKKRTLESKIKQGISRMGKKYQPHSVETRVKIGIAQRGKNNHNWRGGITSESHRIRMSIEWSLWREAVFTRDNWICQKCECRGRKLHPHHIMNFSQYPELRFAIDNGIAFCERCHKKFHKQYGNKNNNKEQLITYLYGN